MSMLRGRHKEIELKRKDERQAAGKLREQKAIEERNERNLLKMKLKEHVKANIYKRQTYRSPQPPVRTFKRKVEKTDNEQDYLKYLGAEFELNDES